MNENINNEKRDFKGVWIPAKIWLNKELSLLEKALLTEINSLDNNDGCFASNEYLAGFLNTSEPTISRAIAKLKTIGYLYQTSFNGRQRTLHANEDIVEPNQIDKAAISKQQGGHINLSKSSIVNNKDNNTKSVAARTVIKKRTMREILIASGEYQENEAAAIELFFTIWERRFLNIPNYKAHDYIKKGIAASCPDETIINKSIDEMSKTSDTPNPWKTIDIIAKKYDAHKRGA